MKTRFETFAEHVDFSGRGLEIGPLAKPMVPEGRADMRYVDLKPREQLAEFYADDPAVDTSAIPEIHYFIERPDGGSNTLSEAVTDGPFDFVVANHVIEHVPDLLGWLTEVAGLVADDGRVLLTVPDRRYSFDALRPASSVGQVLAAHEARLRMPGIGSVYDQVRNYFVVPPRELWRGRVPTPADRFHDLGYVQAVMARVRSGVYVDTHVWALTPRTLVDILDDLGQLGLLELTVEVVLDTRRPRNEFFVVLRRQPRGLDLPQASAQRTAAIERVRAALPDESMTPSHALLARDHERATRKLARLEARNQALRERLRAERARTARLRAEVRRLNGRPRRAARLRRAVRRLLPGR